MRGDYGKVLICRGSIRRRWLKMKTYLNLQNYRQANHFEWLWKYFNNRLNYSSSDVWELHLVIWLVFTILHTYIRHIFKVNLIGTYTVSSVTKHFLPSSSCQIISSLTSHVPLNSTFRNSKTCDSNGMNQNILVNNLTRRWPLYRMVLVPMLSNAVGFLPNIAREISVKIRPNIPSRHTSNVSNETLILQTRGRCLDALIFVNICRWIRRYNFAGVFCELE